MASSVPDNVLVMPHDVASYGESIGPVDYGCVRRYRHRRLLTFLWLHGFRDALRGLLNETDALMSVEHLSRLVQQGLWDDAVTYVSRFLRPVTHPQSDEAQVLIHFLRHHRAFAGMVAGEKNRDIKYFNYKYNSRYLNNDDSVSHDALRLRSIVLSLLHSERVRPVLDTSSSIPLNSFLHFFLPSLPLLAYPYSLFRASLDWDRVRHKASLIVQDLAYKAPELKDLALFPAGSMMPHDVLPIGFRYRRRRYVKEQDLPGSKTLTKIFLKIKKRLPSSTRSHELNTGLTDKTRKWLVDILDESLQAGSLELQSSGVPGATVSHTMLNTLTNLTRNSVAGTPSLANADAHVAPVLQTMSGTLTVPAKISGISSVKNSGAPVSAVSQSVNLTSHAENSGISAVINAGMSKLLSSENSNLRKRPRTEEIIFEQDPHPKSQRTSGPFSEACLVSMTEAGAGAGTHGSISLEGLQHELEHA